MRFASCENCVLIRRMHPEKNSKNEKGLIRNLASLLNEINEDREDPRN